MAKIYPYKSTLEYKVATEYLTEYEYEPEGCKVSYTIPHEYCPDMVHKKAPDILIEIKGYLIKGYQDCQKYLSIIRDNPDKELIFIFSDPDKRAYPQCRQRKDGTTMSLREWCTRNDILFFQMNEIPRDLQKGRWSVEDARAYKRSLFNG